MENMGVDRISASEFMQLVKSGECRMLSACKGCAFGVLLQRWRPGNTVETRMRGTSCKQEWQ